MTLQQTQRIFVNRSLNLGNIKAIGFDMDHTLVNYNRETFEELAFQETIKKFIAAGYPEELSLLKFKPDFVIRGLLVDIDKGNLLKVDRHKYVKIAFHGHTKLDRDSRHKLYNSESFRANKFLAIDSFFALSEVQLFIELVDYMESNPNKISKTFREVYTDLRHFIDLSHQDGSIKNRIFNDTEKFIKFDKHLVVALVRLIDANKSLFLLTNSDWFYTNQIMSLLFDKAHEDFTSWRDYFEYIIVSSAKPGFFTQTPPFYEIDPVNCLMKPFNINESPRKRILHGGNAASFQKLTGFRGDEILYAGDHLYSDIIRSKDVLNWRTLLLVQELEAEIPKLQKVKPLLDKIRDKILEKEQVEEELQILRSKISAGLRQEKIASLRGEKKKAFYLEKSNENFLEKATSLEEEIKNLDKDIKDQIEAKDAAFHLVWGELMKVGLERSRFADQVSDYACIYTSNAANLRFYSPSKLFTAAHDLLPHE